jgi:hypothetical protein
MLAAVRRVGSDRSPPVVNALLSGRSDERALELTARNALPHAARVVITAHRFRASARPLLRVAVAAPATGRLGRARQRLSAVGDCDTPAAVSAQESRWRPRSSSGPAALRTATPTGLRAARSTPTMRSERVQKGQRPEGRTRLVPLDPRLRLGQTQHPADNASPTSNSNR